MEELVFLVLVEILPTVNLHRCKILKMIHWVVMVLVILQAVAERPTAVLVVAVLHLAALAVHQVVLVVVALNVHLTAELVTLLQANVRHVIVDIVYLMVYVMLVHQSATEPVPIVTHQIVLLQLAIRDIPLTQAHINVWQIHLVFQRVQAQTLELAVTSAMGKEDAK